MYYVISFVLVTVMCKIELAAVAFELVTRFIQNVVDHQSLIHVAFVIRRPPVAGQGCNS